MILSIYIILFVFTRDVLITMFFIKESSNLAIGESYTQH